MTPRERHGWFDGGGALVAGLLAVLVAGILLPAALAAAGVRWSVLQTALVSGVAVTFAIVVLGRYSRRIGGLGRRRVRIASLALLALVVAIALTAGMRVRVDQLRGEFADATMTPGDDGRVLRIDGYIGDDFVEQLDEQLARLPRLQRIDITSAGGLLHDTLIAADRIRARSLRVRVVDQCASGCVLLWASAVPREMEVSAVIGLHRTWVDPTIPESWEPRVRGEYEARSLTILRAAGFSEALLARRATTASEAMAYFDAAELLDEGVETLVVDGDGRSLTPRRVRALVEEAPRRTVPGR